MDKGCAGEKQFFVFLQSMEKGRPDDAEMQIIKITKPYSSLNK